MYKRLVIFLMISLLFLSGCASAAATSEAPSAGSGAAPGFNMPEARESAQMDSDGFAAPEEAPAPAVDSGVSAQGENGVQRIVIRNANLTIVVDDPGQSMTTISRMAEGMGGYVVGSNLYKSTGRNGLEYPEASITIRVPAEQLNAALDQIKGLVKNVGTDVLNENISGQDVTKEYTDLQSRLKNLEETEQQLREIMGSATKTEDVLAVYRDLTSIREQIEVIRGQIQYYEESAALSSISVLLQASGAVQPLEIGGWEPVGVARDAVQALIDTVQVLGSIVIWLFLYALPIALLIFVPLRLLWALYKRWRKNGKKPVVVPPPSSTGS